ncbi:MAG: YesL family protein [Oscillospiraceae bacterium]|nr:YesL family protein [Oscillospiraceae bacterium]
MFSMFSPDSKIMQVISRVTDLILLNILFLMTCLPVITVGAATAAMYTLCFRMMREEGSGVIRPYFRAFRENFRQGTAIWLILLLIIGPALFYFDRVWQADSLLRVSGLFFILIAVAGLMTASYVFPWISQFQNTAAQSLQNALILSITHLPRSLAILAINLLPVALWALNYDLFEKISFLWLALYFAAAAYMNCGILWHVFKPYREPHE